MQNNKNSYSTIRFRAAVDSRLKIQITAFLVRHRRRVDSESLTSVAIVERATCAPHEFTNLSEDGRQSCRTAVTRTHTWQSFRFSIYDELRTHDACLSLSFLYFPPERVAIVAFIHSTAARNMTTKRSAG